MNTKLNELALDALSGYDNASRLCKLAQINEYLETNYREGPGISGIAGTAAGFVSRLHAAGWALLYLYNAESFPSITKAQRVKLAEEVRTILDRTEKHKAENPPVQNIVSAQYRVQKNRIDCRPWKKQSELFGRINAILEEKYPNNPDVNYVVKKLSRTLGEDAELALHGNYAVYFPSITEEQRIEIDKAMYAYLKKENIGFLFWDE